MPFYSCPVCREKHWVAVSEKAKNKFIWVEYECEFCDSALIVTNEKGRITLKPKGGNMPSKKEMKERSKEAIKSAKAQKKNDTKKKEETPPVNVEVPCPTCSKIVELTIHEGRYKTQISAKQISGKADNPDFPCPFCNRRLEMPTV